MSKLGDLPRVKQPEPKPVEWKMCRACKAYKAECYVPIGDVSAQMCWLCAHAVVDHDCPLHEAATHECECLPHEIYPNRVIENGFLGPAPQPYTGALWVTPSESAAEIQIHADACADMVLEARHIQFGKEGSSHGASGSVNSPATLRFPHGDTNPKTAGVHSLTGHFFNAKTGMIETSVDGKVVAILGVPVVDESAPVAPVGKRRMRRKPL